MASLFCTVNVHSIFLAIKYTVADFCFGGENVSRGLCVNGDVIFKYLNVRLRTIPLLKKVSIIPLTFESHI